MTREQVIEAFKARGEFSKYSHSYDDVWGHAFRLFNAANPRNPLNTRCGSCYPKVLKWLQA